MLKETWKPKETTPVEGVEYVNFSFFFRSAVVALLRREVDVTLAICFCVLSALIVALTDLYIRPEAH